MTDNVRLTAEQWLARLLDQDHDEQIVIAGALLQAAREVADDREIASGEVGTGAEVERLQRGLDAACRIAENNDDRATAAEAALADAGAKALEEAADAAYDPQTKRWLRDRAAVLRREVDLAVGHPRHVADREALESALEVILARVRCAIIHDQTNDGRCVSCISWAKRIGVPRHLPRLEHDLADHDRRVAAEALREAADELESHAVGSICRSCGADNFAPVSYAVDQLRDRADRLAAPEGNPGSHEGQGER